MIFDQWYKKMVECALPIDPIDGALQFMTLRWQGTKELPAELSLAAEFGLVPLSYMRGFFSLIRGSFWHKLSNGNSRRKNISEQLCGPEDDWASHMFYVN